MILIEGTDGVGKTTLAKAMAKLTRRPYIHYGPMPAWWAQHHYTSRSLMWSVYDRYHWSEWAYAEIRGDAPIADFQACVKIDQIIRERNERYRTIVLFASDDEHFKDLKDDLYEVDKIRVVNSKFHDAQEMFDLAIDISLGWPNAIDVLKKIGLSNELVGRQ